VSSSTRSSDATEAVLLSSRALLGIVARSLAPAHDQVSVPQFRVLVLLSVQSPQRSGELAERIGVHPSTFTRMADRLVAGGWVERTENPQSRREVLVGLTPAGQELVRSVHQRRREEIDTVLRRLSAADRKAVLAGFELFARAAGEPTPEEISTLGT
jgi:DNA-binding MarR family transcriptional regulator